MKRQIFKPALLSLAVSSALCSGQALAQDAAKAADKVEIIEVKGIRGSLNKALGVKRHNEQIVDAIVAEDIGKLPDQSIAESLTRLPGLAGQRVNGPGVQITTYTGSF